MGWRCIITSDSDIEKEQLEEILKAAPQELRMGDLPVFFNGWGWTMATDVELKDKHTIRIGGSYSISGHKAQPMRSYLKKELKKRQHKVCSKFYA